MPRSTHACRFDVLIKRARSSSADLNICSLMFFVRNSVQTSWRACQSPSTTAWQTYRKKSRIRSGTVAPMNFTVISHAANTAVAPDHDEDAGASSPSPQWGVRYAIYRGHVLLAVTMPRIDEKAEASRCGVGTIAASCVLFTLHGRSATGRDLWFPGRSARSPFQPLPRRR